MGLRREKEENVSRVGRKREREREEEEEEEREREREGSRVERENEIMIRFLSRPGFSLALSRSHWGSSS